VGVVWFTKLQNAAAELNYMKRPVQESDKPADVFLSPDELAQRWKFHPKTLARYHDRLNPVRLNSRVIRYPLASVLAVEKAGTV
jgi:hypothetical protein